MVRTGPGSPRYNPSPRTIAREDIMFRDRKNTSRIRMLAAERARANRLEMVKAVADGQISKRDLLRWGVYGAGGLIAAKHGLSPLVRSAYAAVPTGTPASPTFGAVKFHEPLNRAQVQPRIPLLPAPRTATRPDDVMWIGANGRELPELRGRRLSYHDDWTKKVTGYQNYKNPLTGRGPIEGRPPGEFFAHQRWSTDPTSKNRDLFPKVGYLFTLAQCQPTTRYCAEMPYQNANAMWSFGTGRDIGFVSISIDPVTDTPERLKRLCRGFWRRQGLDLPDKAGKTTSTCFATSWVNADAGSPITATASCSTMTRPENGRRIPPSATSPSSPIRSAR